MSKRSRIKELERQQRLQQMQILQYQRQLNARNTINNTNSNNKVTRLFDGCFYVVIGIFALFIIMLLSFDDSNNDTEKTTTHKQTTEATTKATTEEQDNMEKFMQATALDTTDFSACYFISKEIIESCLKNPKSAEFPSSSEIGYEKTGGLIAMQGYVDATNSYGAVVRTEWTVQFFVLDIDNLMYEVSYIKLGDEVSGEFLDME